MRRAALLAVLALSCAPRAAPLPVPPPAPPGPAPEGMVWIPPGNFVRGHDPPGRGDESPPHLVELHGFYFDRTLVTRADFERFVARSGYLTTAEVQGYGFASAERMADWEWERVPHASWRRPFIAEDEDSRAFLQPDAPVVMVTYFDAVAYCAHLGKRLPTEAEWEYAMRAGSSGTRYPWGDSPERDGRLALNFWQGASHRKNLREDGYVYVSPVTAFAPNAWGIYDPVGNVWQWTADVYDPGAYRRASLRQPARDPHGPASGPARVLRGGSWWCGACTCEGNGLYFRGKAEPGAAFNNSGFRCARDLDSAPPGSQG